MKSKPMPIVDWVLPHHANLIVAWRAVPRIIPPYIEIQWSDESPRAGIIVCTDTRDPCAFWVADVS